MWVKTLPTPHLPPHSAVPNSTPPPFPTHCTAHLAAVVDGAEELQSRTLRAMEVAIGLACTHAGLTGWGGELGSFVRRHVDATELHLLLLALLFANLSRVSLLASDAGLLQRS